jgi:hypothetical protein
MKRHEIVVGHQYRARITGRFVTVRVDQIREGYTGRTVYDVTNLVTGRHVTFRSAQRFRSEVSVVVPTAAQVKSSPCPCCDDPAYPSCHGSGIASPKAIAERDTKLQAAGVIEEGRNTV